MEAILKLRIELEVWLTMRVTTLFRQGVPASSNRSHAVQLAITLIGFTDEISIPQVVLLYLPSPHYEYFWRTRTN